MEKQNGHTNGHVSPAHFVAQRDPLDPRGLVTGKRIVLLGGTGFLGKIFTSMLLFRFPELERVYLLVRKGSFASSEARFFGDIAQTEPFRPIRERLGDGYDAFIREKVVPIDGDVGQPLCGIDRALLQELRGSIAAVVNVAGVVDFNPPLDEALDANAFGAQNLVALAKALGDAPLLHTSTCYTAGFRKGPILEEDPFVHPFPRCEELGKELWDPDREVVDCLDVIAQAKHRCDDAFRQSEFRETAKKNLLARGEPTQGAALEQELAKVRRKWVADKLVEAGIERATHWGWPNTYTYTKSIGEQLIARSGLRNTIVRPACCETTMDYPFRGWNEGISTTVPFMFLAMKGQTHLPGGRDAILDLIPSDMVASGMILALLELLEGSQAPLYQLGASDSNPCSSARFGELGGLYKRKSYQKRGGNPLVNFVQAHFEPAVISMGTIESVGAPAFARVAKTLATALKQTPVPLAKPAGKALDDVAKSQERIGDLLRLFAPFSGNTLGPFSCKNVCAAFARLPAEYKDVVRWTPEAIDWAEYYFGIHMPALEKWILPEMEKRMVREPKPLRPHATLATLVDEMAQRHGHSVALSNFEADGLFSRVTFEDVRARRDAVAARLASLGVTRGDRVVLGGKNHPDWALAYFGIVRAGAAAVPVDPELETAALENIVRESGAKVCLFDAHVQEKNPGVASVNLHEICRESANAHPPDVTIEESDLASVIFTSGTTGKPKGVKLTHKNFATMIAALATIFPLNQNDRVLSVLPLHHTFEFSCGLLLPFSRGARVQYVGELSGERLTHALEAGRATAMVGVPALWQVIERRVRAQVDARGPLVRAAFDFASSANRKLGRTLGIDAGKVLFSPIHGALGGSLRMLISGGAALPKETQELFLGLGLPLSEGYGLTEAAPVLTASKPSPKTRPGHVGKPVPGVEIRIDNPDESGVGEVLARGPNVMAGYTDEEATQRVLGEDGWLRTGDLGKLDKRGQLQIVGRIKDVIVTTTGENVYPDDVERALGEIDGISELAVVGISSPKGGERVACLAVPKRDSLLPDMASDNRESALSALRAKIATLPYHQQPAVVHLYDAVLPRTATRKVKRKEVQGILERLVLATTTPDDASAELGPVRLAIAAVSGRSAREIGTHTTLQGDLGFDSLMLAELLEALEARGRVIDATELQSCRSVEDVERLYDGAHHKFVKKDKPPSTAKIEGREESELRLPPQLQDAAKGLIGKLQDTFYGQVMKPKVTGRAFIPHNRNVIIVANHASHLDMGFVRHALGKYGEDIVSLAAQDYFFDQGIKRAFFENFTNLKAIDRKGGARASLRQAKGIIEQGKTVLVFPEGTRSSTGEIQEFKPLVGHLALAHGVDILPVYLGGTYEAMPKGVAVPTRREITARIGPPLCIADLRRLTEGKTQADAAREVSRLAREALLALRDGRPFDLARGDEKKETKHPLVSLFEELEEKFLPGAVDKPVSFYFTLGSDDLSKWTLRIDPSRCEVKLGKPEGGTADCVLKTTPEIFTRIVREAYVPGVAEFLSGAVKSNDVGLLQTFQKAFQLG